MKHSGIQSVHSLAAQASQCKSADILQIQTMRKSHETWRDEVSASQPTYYNLREDQIKFKKL